MGKWFVLTGLIVLTLACTHGERRVNPAFYYWKTVYQADSTEQAYLSELRARRLYVRMMDVDNQGPNGEPIPVSPIVFKHSLPDSIQLVPVVFIVNNVLKGSTETTLNELAERIYAFVQSKVKQAGKSEFDELQIDCDWTASTRVAYFYLLDRLRLQLSEGTSLSATLRLHQVRSPQSSGTPPVDRVLLMCYNMGNLRQFGPQNSILSMDDMTTYLKGHLRTYPLPMDVALPLFSWSVVFRNEQYAGISKRLDPTLLSDTTLFSRLDDAPLFRLKAPLAKSGLQKGDVIRREIVSHREVIQAARFLADELPRKDFTLIYYHLDNSLLADLSAGAKSPKTSIQSVCTTETCDNGDFQNRRCKCRLHEASKNNLFTNESLQEIIDSF